MTSRLNGSERESTATTSDGQRKPRRRRKKPPPTARETALRMVARRLLSERELRQRLARREFEAEAIDDAVELVKEYGYINDRELAGVVQRESLRNGRGPRWVHSTLRRRGVADELARDAEADVVEGSAARAREVAMRRFGNPADMDEKTRERALRHLLSRGFPPDAALDALDAVE